MTPIEDRNHFRNLLDSFDTALLVTHGRGRSLHCRPMTVADVEHDACVWFVTSLDAGKVREVTTTSSVCVACQSGRKFLSLSGEATVVHDRARIRDLWKESWRVWFPSGPTDNSIALIRVEPTEGEYWDGSGLNGLAYLFKAGKAYFAGEKIEPVETMNRFVSFREPANSSRASAH